MKNPKIRIIFAILILALTAMACGNGEIILAPDSIEAQADRAAGGSGVVTVDGRPTLRDQYDDCVKKMIQDSPESMDTDLFGDDTVFWQCGKADLDNVDLALVNAGALAKFVPGQGDDVTVYGIAAIKNIVYVIVAAAVGQKIGDSLVVWHHSSKDHSPTIAGSTARQYIQNLYDQMTAFLQNGGKDPRNNCGYVQDETGTIIKVAFLFIDTVTNETITAWYWLSTPGTPWGGSYPKSYQGKGSFENGPSNLKPGWQWHVGPDLCSRFNVPSLQAAQP